jgi:hypothetical protein
MSITSTMVMGRREPWPVSLSLSSTSKAMFVAATTVRLCHRQYPIIM